MNETRIAVALVAVAAALLVGTVALVVYERGVVRDERAASAQGPVRAGQEEARTTPEDNGDRATGGAAVEDRPEDAPSEGAGDPPSGAAGPTGEAADPPGGSELAASDRPTDVPPYSTLRETEADGVTEVIVATEATEKDEMRLVASDLATYYPGAGVLLLEFRDGSEGGAQAGRETGFALVFESREAALAPDLKYTPEEVDEIFEEDGGVRAVSYEDMVEEDPSLEDDLERIRTS